MKKEIVYKTDWIYQLESETHWRSYWHQQKIMEGRLAEGDEILEIGVGSGFCANYLRTKGYRVVTLDIDERKKPDIVANICTAELSSEYDHILAFEVFEHFPHEAWPGVLEKLHNHCRKYLFVSLPESRLVLCDVRIKIKMWPRISFSMKIPNFWLPTFLRKKLHEDSTHHWEINYSKKHSLAMVKKQFQQAGFRLEKYHAVNFMSHHFFVLDTRKSD